MEIWAEETTCDTMHKWQKMVCDDVKCIKLSQESNHMLLWIQSFTYEFSTVKKLCVTWSMIHKLTNVCNYMTLGFKTGQNDIATTLLHYILLFL